MKERIKELMNAQHMSQQSFAEVLGISAASLSSIFNERTKPTINHVEAIKKKFPSVNTDWLMFGRGQMYDDEKNVGTQTQPSPMEKGNDVSQPFDLFNQPSTGGTVALNKSISDSRTLPISKTEVKYIEKPLRKITEIRVFYDDQTWETFVPSK